MTETTATVLRPIGTPQDELARWRELEVLDFEPETECDYIPTDCLNEATWRIRCRNCHAWGAVCDHHAAVMLTDDTDRQCSSCGEATGTCRDIFIFTKFGAA